MTEDPKRTSPWGSYQTEIYQAGSRTGEVPPLPTNLRELESVARTLLAPEALGYIMSSAGDSNTARANVTAFDSWRIVPRVLAGVQERDMQTELLGHVHPTPLLIAPVGVQTLAHPEGELAMAKAAEKFGVPYVHSQAASYSFEQIAEAAPNGQRWSQFYWLADEDVNDSFLDRARRAGFSSLVLTVDTLVLGWRPADLDRAYLPFLQGVGVANYTSDPAFMSRLEPDRRSDPRAVGEEWLKIFPNPGLTWKDIKSLRQKWEGSLLVKGISAADDARKAIDHGFDGVIVSNHGGRQVDGALAALDALPGVITAVNDQLPVLFDSGVRSGSDVFKALALGARSVLIGRPALYGLALSGQSGVEHVLRCVLAELDLTMALSGNRSISAVGVDSLVLSPRK